MKATHPSEQKNQVNMQLRLTEVGMIPHNWEVARLADLAPLVTGSTPPTRDRANYGDEYLFISPADLGGRKFVLNANKRLSKKGFEISRRLPADSILFVCIGSTIGKCGIAPHELATNQQINALLPATKTSRDFLYYSLCAAAERIRALAGEQAVPMVSKSDFGETLIALPPMREQHAIGAVLSGVDLLIERLDGALAKKRDLRQAAMQQLLGGRRRLSGSQGKWRTKSFDEVLTKLNARPHQLPATEYLPTGDHPVVDQGQRLVAGFCDRDDLVLKCPPHGVIVFGDHTCIVKYVNFDFVVGADGTQILLPRKGNSARFLAFYLQYHELAQSGYNRHFKLLREVSFHVPAENEQNAIAGVLAAMDDELILLEARREKVLALKQAMMQQLLTGRIRLI